MRFIEPRVGLEGAGRSPLPRRLRGVPDMRILVVNWLDRRNPQSGGAETHLHEIFGRLAAKGHQVRILASGWQGAPPEEQLDGIQIVRVGGRWTFTMRAPGAAREIVEAWSPDVVVEDLNKVPLYLPRRLGCPVVALVHHLFGRVVFQEASFPVALTTWLLEGPIPWAYRRSPIVAVSESTANDLRRRGLTRTRIEVIPNGIDPGAYRSPDRKFPEPTLIYLGRLKRYKRVELILEAVAALAEQDVACRLLVVGKGDHGPALERTVRRLGIEGRVSFLGYVPEEEKVSLLTRSWVHVLTSPREGWGIVNLEAAACGTPTVASDSPGLRDSVVDGQTGVLVPHGNVPALAAALRKLLEDGGLRDRMGEHGRRFAEGFSWDRSAEAMERFLRESV